MEQRILKLRPDQIAALFGLVGIKFKREDIESVVSEVIENKNESMHLGILLDEADSIENLEFWVSYFEQHK